MPIEWRIDTIRIGDQVHWSARNEKTGERLEADSRRELCRKIAATQEGSAADGD